MTAVTKRTRLLLALLIVLTGVGCDQATKQLAAQQLRGTPPISFMHDIVRLHYAENRGAFLGLGNTLSPEMRFWLLTVDHRGPPAGLNHLPHRAVEHRSSFVYCAFLCPSWWAGEYGRSAAA